MGACFSGGKTKDKSQPHSAPGDYPRNPAYANCNQSQMAMMPHGIPQVAGGGFMTGQGGGGGMMEGAAVGYMMGQGGGMGMMSGIDGGPRVAIGGTYHGMM